MKLSLAHLPQSARDLIDLIGLPKALILIEARGGRALEIARGKREQGRAQIAALAEIVGREAADKIVARYQGTVLVVPKCKRALLAVRDGQLQARFDALTKEAGCTARSAVAILGQEFDLVDSSVWRALKRDAMAAPPPGENETRQQDLFAA